MNNYKIILCSLLFYFISLISIKFFDNNCNSYKKVLTNTFVFFIIYLILFEIIYKKEYFQVNSIKINNIIKNNNESHHKIPKTIIQTYYSNYVNPIIANNIQSILKNNPDYQYLLITDLDGIELIKNNFDEYILQAFLKLNIGAAKGDFIRYISLYLYGGVYIDLDSSITINLDDFIDYNLDFIFFYDHAYNLMNTPIITKKNNPIILKLIYEVSKRIHNNEKNIFLATGPTVFTDVVFHDITNENIYNVSQNINTNKRKEILINHKFYKNGLLLYKKPFFKFRMDNYSENLLYKENKKYIVTYNSPTPNLYK